MANEQKCVQFDEGRTKKDGYFWDFTVYRKPSIDYSLSYLYRYKQDSITLQVGNINRTFYTISTFPFLSRHGNVDVATQM